MLEISILNMSFCVAGYWINIHRFSWHHLILCKFYLLFSKFAIHSCIHSFDISWLLKPFQFLPWLNKFILQIKCFACNFEYSWSKYRLAYIFSVIIHYSIRRSFKNLAFLLAFIEYIVFNVIEILIQKWNILSISSAF